MKLFLKMKEAYNIDSEEEIKEKLSEEIKKVNKIMPAYKAIKGLIITEEELIKTISKNIIADKQEIWAGEIHPIYGGNLRF